MPKRTTKPKKSGLRRALVLGLRATPEQRAWLNMKAAERNLSLQGLFEEMMLQQPGSPWLQETDTLLAVPIEDKDFIARVAELTRKRDRDPVALTLLETFVRQTELSMLKKK